MNRIEKSDYIKLAKTKNVRWIGMKLPPDTRTSTDWECLACGRPLRKSYYKMKSYPNACRCRSDSIRTPDDYSQLAKDISERFSTDFEYTHDDYPQNTYEKVTWMANGVEISESYHNLAYFDKLPSYVEALLK